MPDPEIEEVLERLDRFDAERAIVETMYAYGSALDYGDRDRFLQCFTDDADYVVDMRIGADGGFAFHGQEELTKYFEDHTHAPTAWHKHVTTNPSIEIHGDTARASSYFLRVDAGTESAPAYVLASGRYLDDFVRDEDGRWRIRSRRCEVENL
jgi:ketosteroid isomerase-like protein